MHKLLSSPTSTQLWNRDLRFPLIFPKSKIPTVKVIALVITVLSFCNRKSNAAQLLWDGGGPDNNWSTASNWNPNVPPNPGDDLNFDGLASTKPAVADMAISVNSLRIINNYTSTISITGDVIINSSITIPSSTWISLRGGFLEVFDASNNSAIELFGKLEWDPLMPKASTLTVRGDLNIYNGGMLMMGTAGNPIPSNRKAQLFLDTGGLAGNADLTVVQGGKLWAFGAAVDNAALSASVSGGMTFNVTFSSHVANWRVGDFVVVGKTDRSNTDDSEKKMITSILGNQITVDSAFTHMHSINAPVVNLTRNVVIESLNGSANGTISSTVQSPQDIDLQNIELKKLGSTSGSMAAVTFTGALSQGRIIGSSIHEGEWHGILIDFSTNVTISKNTIYKQGGMGLYLNGATACNINGNFILSQSQHGIYFNNNARANSLSENYVYSNQLNGITSISSTKNNINSNKVFANNNDGIVSLFSGSVQAGENTFEYNDVFQNNNNGLSIQMSRSEIIGDNQLSYNGGHGLVLDTTYGNVLENNFSFSNILDGYFVSYSSKNIFSLNNSHNNGDEGIELFNSNENTILHGNIFSNAGYGLYLSGSDKNLMAEINLGWNGGASNPNTLAEISISPSIQNLVLLNSRINNATSDVDTSNFSAAGRSLISFRHNQAAGETRLYGDYQLANEEFKVDYADVSYRSKATLPLLIRGTGHAATITSVIDNNAVTQQIIIEYENDSQWHINGSVSGDLGSFVGNQTNLPVPSGSPQFYLDFLQGGSPKVEDEIDFALLGAGNDAGQQKKLLFGKSANGFNNGHSRLTVTNGSTFTALGTSLYPTLIDGINSGTSSYYSFITSGSFHADQTKFDHLDENGLVFSGNVSVSLSSVTFDRSISLGGNTYLKAQDLLSEATFYAVVFNDSDSTMPTNVRTAGNTNFLSWTFDNWGGSRGGPSFEVDPDNRIHWAGVSSTATLLSPYFTYVSSSALQVSWLNVAGSSYTAVLATDPGFTAIVDSNTVTSNVRNYSYLNPDTLYYFTVKIATEPDTSYNPAISTRTLPAPPSSGTVLSPYFSFVGLDVINANWNPVPGAVFNAVLALDPTFTVIHDSITIGVNNRNYGGLSPNTSYYFKVKVATEPDTSYSPAISTRTYSNSMNYTLKFDGDNKLVFVPHDVIFDLSNDSTVELWFRKLSTAPLSQHLLSKDNYSRTNGWALYLTSNNQLRFQVFGGPGLQDTNSINDLNWHHAALTRYGSTGSTKLYLDGIQIAQSTISFVSTNSDPFLFGNSNDQTKDFNGLIDEVRIWDKVKIQVEIQNDRFVKLNGTEPFLKSYFDLNEGNGQTVGNLVPSRPSGSLGLTYAPESTDPLWWAENIPGFGAPADAIPPSAMVLHPVHGSSHTISSLGIISGTAEDNQALVSVALSLKRFSDGKYFYRFINGGGYWAAGETFNSVTGLMNWIFPGYEVAWSTGQYEIRVKAEDGNFNIGFATSNFTVVSSTDITPPSVYISYPINQSTYTANDLTTMSGTASDNEALLGTGIQIRRNLDGLYWNGDTLVWMSTPIINFAYGLQVWNYYPPYSAWTSSGSYNITAYATDMAMNQSSQTITVYLNTGGGGGSDVIPPTVAILHPSSGSIHPPAALTLLSGTANDNIALIEVLLKIKDLNTSQYWTGTSFGSSETWHFLSGYYNWSYGGVPELSWTDDHMYELVVRARDGAGNIKFATSTFSVDTANGGDTIPPFVEIVLPVPGGIYQPSTLIINGNASDNQGLVGVFVSLRKNSNNYYYDGEGFNSGVEIFHQANGYNYWNYYVPPVAFSNDNYTLVAVATDTAGLTSMAQVSFNIDGAGTNGDVTPPSAEIQFPVEGAVYNDEYQLTNLSGTANDNESLNENSFSMRDDTNHYWNGVDWNSESEIWNPIYGNLYQWIAYMPPLAWKNGNFQMRLRVRDGNNNITYDEVNFTTTDMEGSGNPDTESPTVIVYNPVPGSVGNPYTFNHLNGRCEDAFGILEVKFSILNITTNLYWNGTSFTSSSEVLLSPQISSSTPFSLDWYHDVPFNAYTNGPYLFKVQAKDPSQNTRVIISTYTVQGAGQGGGDVTPPALAVQHPLPNQTYEASQLTVMSGTAYDQSGLSEIEVKIIQDSTGYSWDGSAWVQSEIWLTAGGLQTWTFSSPLGMWADGNYTLSFRAWDVAQNQFTQTLGLTVAGQGQSGTPPTVAILHPQNGQTYSPSSLMTLSGTAIDDVSVSFVRYRITDLTTLWDWDPITQIWSPSIHWTNAILNGNEWSTIQIPYWAQGHYQLMAEAEDSDGLISISSLNDFYVQVGTGTDYTAPGYIANLSAAPGSSQGQVLLQWTATGDDGQTGTASSYRIKYSPNAPIVTEQNWIDAFSVEDPPLSQVLPLPKAPGLAESFVVSNLVPGVPNFWAIRAWDESGNRSPISNSPSAASNGGCQSGVGDGEGSALVSPASFAENTQQLATLTFTVGAHGITSGGKINAVVPPNWTLPQNTVPATPGYTTVTTNNGTVTLGLTFQGPQIMVSVQSGTLNTGDTVTIGYLAYPYCGVGSGIPFQVMSQAASCGQPQPIGSQPTFSVSAGPATWIGFDSTEKFVNLNQIVSVDMKGRNTCGAVASLGANVNVQVSAVVLNQQTYAWDSDANAVLSESSDLSNPFTDQSILFAAGQSQKTVYYRLTTPNASGPSHIRIQYLDIQSGSFNSENNIRIIPISGGSGLSNLSVDTGSLGALTQATISPDNDGNNDIAYINFNTSDPNLSWRIQVSNDGFITTPWEWYGTGSPARRAWDGRRSIAPFDVLPGGTYQVKVSAAGIDDTSLSVVVSATGVSGTVQDSVSTLPVQNAQINVFGPVNRFTTTDVNGVFTLTGLPIGTYQLQIEKMGYAPTTASVPVNGGSQNLGTLSFQPLAKVVFASVRQSVTLETWGQLRGLGGNESFSSPIHFALGNTAADNGFSGESAHLFLKPDVSYAISAELPGYTVTPIQQTFVAGQIYEWSPSLTSQSNITGTISLANGIQNTTGVAISLSAGLDANSDGQYDLGYPTRFVNTTIPAFESLAPYELPGFSDGIYRVELHANGFVPQNNLVTIAGASSVLNFTIGQNGQMTVNVQFAGDTTGLNSGSGTFPVTLRLVSQGTFSAVQTIYIPVDASATSGIATFTGVPNGTYTLYYDDIQGFSPNPAGPRTNISVAGGVGSTSLTFNAYTGSLVGTVTLPPGSTMNDLQIRLDKDGRIWTAPVIAGAQFTFSNLGTGIYNLSLNDSVSNVSTVRQVSITNGQATPLSINLASLTTFTLSGTVRTVAAPPLQNLSAIAAASLPTTIYTNSGSTTWPGFRVEAYLVNSDNSIATLPTISGTILDPAKIKYASVNSVTGAYQIAGLVSGKTYRVRLNPDIDSNSVSNFPLEEKVLNLTANKSGEDFTIRDGASISGTLTAPLSDNGHSLNVTLTDTNLNQVIRTSQVSLVGTSVEYTFANLRVGRYVIRVQDLESPAKYAAKPEFVGIETLSDRKTVPITLTRGSVIRGKLADKQGRLLTSTNYSSALPTDFKIRLISKGHVVDASGPASDGTFMAEVVPGSDYIIEIKPPLNMRASDRGKSFLPTLLTAKVDAGQFYDWGIVTLLSGTSVTGTIVDESATPLEGIPVFAYQSLARSLTPLSTLTNNQGQFTFEALDSRIRFYDFVANPVGQANSDTDFSAGQRTMIDITKTQQTQNLSISLKTLSSAAQGQFVSVNNLPLIAAYGSHRGLPGVSILIRKRGSSETTEYISASDGSFNIPLIPGQYDFEFMAKSHRPELKKQVTVGAAGKDFGSISLLAGVILEGTLRNADGSLPKQSAVKQMLALDSSNNISKASLVLEPVTESVDRYVFPGMVAGVYTIVTVDENGRSKIVSENLTVPNQDSVVDFTFDVSEPQLMASFIQKLPDGVEAIFSCNQSFRNQPDDLNSNGTPDDNEFLNFVSITRGNGSLAFNSVSADRQKAAYTYTKGNETGISSLELAATFRTEETDPETGSDYVVQGSFSHPFGLQSQQEDLVTNLGGQFVLPSGAEFSLPENWSADSNLDGTLVKFQAADSLETIAGISPLGAGAISLAKQLGPSAYPPHMYRAIQALSDVPDVNPFSSFYDIFLPATVSRLFTNKPTLTLKYDDSVTDPYSLNVYYFVESDGVYTIENENRVIDTVNKTISVSIRHASIFTVLASSQSIIRGDSFSGAVSVFNFPNPFDLNSKSLTLQHPGSNSASQTVDGTMIKVSLPDNVSGDIKIEIFNVAGELVRTVRGNAPTGGSHYYIEWDGKNDNGAKVASGVYIGRLTVSGSNERFFKMAVIK